MYLLVFYVLLFIQKQTLRNVDIPLRFSDVKVVFTFNVSERTFFPLRLRKHSIHRTRKKSYDNVSFHERNCLLTLKAGRVAGEKVQSKNSHFCFVTTDVLLKTKKTRYEAPLLMSMAYAINKLSNSTDSRFPCLLMS